MQAPTNSQHVLTVCCDQCRKTFRITRYPQDSDGRPSTLFRMTCLKCGHEGIYALRDVQKVSATTTEASPQPERRSA